MRLLLIPLVILILVAISVQMINSSPLDYTTVSGSEDNPAINSTQLEELQIQSMNFNLTVMGGFIALFTAAVAVGILSGLNISVLGSTVQISERSQNLLYHSLFYGGLWGIFSVLATIGINGIGIFSIPIFGLIFYGILTLFYVLGINQQIQKG